MNPNAMLGSKTKVPKTGWRRYAGTLGLGVLGTFLTGYFWLFHAFNQTPAKSDLTQINIEVLSVREAAPHLVVQLDDGSRKHMEFPIGLPFIGGRAKGGAYNAINERERTQLKGCRGVVGGVPLRYSFDQRFRVWSIDCGGVKKDFAFFADNWTRYGVAISFFGVKFMFIVFSMATTLVFWAEWRKK